jgi:hypothetical protein
MLSQNESTILSASLPAAMMSSGDGGGSRPPPPKRGPGPKQSFTLKQLKEALSKAAGIVADAARLLHCSRATVNRAIKEHEDEMRPFLENLRETVLDFVESKFMEHLNAGNLTSLIFYLKCKGGARGWKEKSEVDGNVKGTLGVVQINITPTDAKL